MSRKSVRREVNNPTTIAGPHVMTKICPECKKAFDWYGEQWVYRDQKRGVKRYFCSCKCWRAEDHRKGTKLRGEGYQSYGDKQNAPYADDR